MRAIATRGRWLWGLSGLAVITAIAIPGVALATRAGSFGGPPPQTVLPARTVTVTQSVTSLNVESYGALIHVIGGSVRRTTVTEMIRYTGDSPKGGPSGPPFVIQSVSHGRLTLAAPACGVSNCSVGFTVTVPSDVSVTARSDGGPLVVSDVAAADVDSGGGLVQVTRIGYALTVNAEGGPVMVSGVSGGNLDSGGGPMEVTNVSGPLTANTEGGGLTLDDLSGPLDADTGSGPLLARGIAAVTASVNTEGGNTDMTFTTAPQAVTVTSGGGSAELRFATAPRSVTLSTDGGPATVIVPGGPYAVTANDDGGSEYVGVAVDQAAHRSINVTSGGGPLAILPPGGQPPAGFDSSGPFNPPTPPGK